MTTISIIGCICTVVGLCITLIMTVGKPIVNNTKMMTELTDAIKNLGDQFCRFEASNSDSHKHIHNRIDKHDEKLEEHEQQIHEHETRISILENRH